MLGRAEKIAVHGIPKKKCSELKERDKTLASMLRFCHDQLTQQLLPVIFLKSYLIMHTKSTCKNLLSVFFKFIPMAFFLHFPYLFEIFRT